MGVLHEGGVGGGESDGHGHFGRCWFLAMDVVCVCVCAWKFLCRGGGGGDNSALEKERERVAKKNGEEVERGVFPLKDSMQSGRPLI